ncbi:MAG TPA: hypothetical protein VHX12_02840 [Acidisoma sp.]|nr:hypothetical protein [Acidisoma sp.]
MSQDIEEIIRTLAADRVKMHRVLFAHRHKDSTPPFLVRMILDWHSPVANHCDIAFRGSAKSTTGEEAIILKALLREFQHCIIFGESADRACERLHSIRREFEKNQFIHQIFGHLRGQPWGDDQLELTTGIVIQAMGRGQAIRGTKQEISRPDLIFADDIEDRASVSTPEGRDKIQKWFLGDVLPACDPDAKVRIAANALDPECLAVRLKASDSGFQVKTYPWEYIDRDGARQATWPDRFPLPIIDSTRKRMYALGRGREYQMEYMCEASPPEDKPFRSDMFRTSGHGGSEPVIRTWQAVYAMLDPARTVRSTSATTGCAVWSWIGNRLIVWESWGRMLMPDEIVNAIFDIDAEFDPTMIYVEEDGLNEFLMQPIRQEQVRRGRTVPVKAVRAPKGKMDFIRGLQPWFNAREVIFAKDLPDLKQQLLGFPTGRIDAPNALAYAPRLRAGAPIYDGFSARNCNEDLRPAPNRPVWLALNATRTITTGVLLQVLDGSLRIYADWVSEGDCRETAPRIIQEVAMETGGAVRPIMGAIHSDPYNNVGLMQAVKAMPRECWSSGRPEDGRISLIALLGQELRGFPALLINKTARWTLNGFAGGYARAINKQGMLADHAEEGVYRTLMEGLESTVGLLSARGGDDDEAEKVYAWTPGGRRYLSALPQRG